MELIACENLEKVYGSVGAQTHALAGVSFSIQRGEFVVIMGPSGSGKSTLLQILGLLDRPTSGRYVLDGRDTETYHPDELAKLRNEKIGFIFQSFHLLARTSVLENVTLPLIYSLVPEVEWNDRARRAIETVGLTHRIQHLPSELSGGERQRVAIARSLVNDPSVIFADEPTGNLDSKNGALVMDLLQHLNRQQRHTILLITHDESAARAAERRLLIRDGRIV